jgi:hypothetical protein
MSFDSDAICSAAYSFARGIGHAIPQLVRLAFWLLIVAVVVFIVAMHVALTER